MSFFQYLKDTQGELRHVAWPTRFQTIVYTALVILFSVFVALYLGLFDFLFTAGLRNVLQVLPQGAFAPKPQISVTQVPAGAPAAPAPDTSKKN